MPRLSSASLAAGTCVAPNASPPPTSAMLILLVGGGEALGATQVPAARLALLSRGINLDNIVSSGRLANYDSADMAMLTSMGFTFVRIPIDPGWVIEGVPMDGQTDLSSADHAA